ncbi:MAG: T9SS type A sorting domain-containing protein [Saprospiraceae bacterium]|nr:T9SS type A sorting domain-containing protein [Saprospiraceae bacterium]
MTKKLLLSFCAVLMMNLMFAQYFQTSWINAGRNPSGINNDNEYPPGGGLPAGWSTILGNTASYTRSYSSIQSIGFPFLFNNQPVSKFKVSSSGILTFDTATVLGLDTINQILPSTKVPDKSICMWGLGCWPGDYIVRKTFGNPGARQLWISFNSYHEKELQIQGYFYGSIVLEEGTNAIYLVEQRTLCVLNNTECTGKTSLTLGIQLDQSTAYNLDNTASYAFNSGADYTPKDNSYHEYLPGQRPNHDVAGVDFTNKRYYSRNDLPVPLTANYRNVGESTINSYNLNYSVNGLNPTVEKFSGLNIKSLDAFKVRTNKAFNGSAGEYDIKLWLSDINGSSPSTKPANDTVTGLVTLVDSFVQRKVLHETFTSSTCPPCVPGNINLETILLSNEDRYTSIKYQFYFPGTGDPYTTQEGRNRGTSYQPSVTLVPTTFIDGTTRINPSAYTSDDFENATAVPAFISIEPRATINADHKVNIDTKITGLTDFKGGLVLYTAICEKTTSKNLKTNGEREFYHVMKKMLPTDAGKSLPAFNKLVSQDFHLDFSFKGNYRLPLDGQVANHINHATEHCVEEFSDLEVVQFIQDQVTKVVYQSESVSVEVLTNASNPVYDVFDLNVYPNPANEMLHLKWIAPTNEVVRIDLVNSSGQVIYHSQSDLSQLIIDLKNIPSGIYSVRLYSGRALSSKMVIIQANN